VELFIHAGDAGIDYAKVKYEIPLNRYFYLYQPPRLLDVIGVEIEGLEQELMAMLAEVV
jgi:type I restriction enzyme M protein